jgi:hypothetical protein
MKTILKKQNTIIIASGLLAIGIFFNACTKKVTTPPNPNEEELITTIKLTLVDSTGVKPTVVAQFRDIDGDGGASPIQWDTIRLHANTTYMGTIELLDESNSPVDTISNEVRNEGVDHLFCFNVSGLQTQIQRTDADANGLELGLSTKWHSGTVGKGNINIQLRHQPGIKNGTCSVGASDIDLVFQMEVN